mgnify:CR=1 FL=1
MTSVELSEESSGPSSTERLPHLAYERVQGPVGYPVDALAQPAARGLGLEVIDPFRRDPVPHAL